MSAHPLLLFVLTLALTLSAESARAFVVVPTPCVIKAVTIPVPTAMYPGYCFAAPVIEIDHVPGATTYRETYTQVDTGTIGSKVGVPPDFVFVNLSGQGGTLHPPAGKHWVVLGGLFGTTCALAESYASDDYADPHCEGRVPNEQLTAALAVSQNSIGPESDVTVTLTVTNSTTGPVSGISAPAALTLGGANPDIVEKKSGPDPGSAVTLAAGAKQEFAYVYRTRGNGNVTLSAQVDGLNASSATVPSNIATATLEVQSPLTLEVTATTPVPEGAHSGEVIRYALDARATKQATTLTVSATFRPDLVEVLPGSSPNGVIANDTITWTLTDVTGTVPPLEFQVKVKPLLPDTILFIPMQAQAHAVFPGASPADASDDGTVKFLKSNLTIHGEAFMPRGDYVLPEEEIRYRLSAEAKATADEIVLEAPIPAGTKLVDGSITGGGAESGSTIRWTFTDRIDTPVVEYRVVVVELKKIPKDLDRITTNLEARADFDGALEQASATLEVELVRPTDLRGVVRDIILAYPKSFSVQTPALSGIEVRLLDHNGVEVDTATTDGKGKFNVQLAKAGTYRLEARTLGDVYVLSQNAIVPKQREIRALHAVKLDDEDRLFVDGRELVRDRKGTPEVFEAAYVPISLVRRVSEQIREARNFSIKYLFVKSFDIGPYLGDLDHYDVTSAVRLLDKAIELDAFINNDGTLAHFHGLFRGSGDEDGWNALIRLSAFLVQLNARVQEAARLVDALGKTIALAVTTNFVSQVIPKLPAQWQARLGTPTGPYSTGQQAILEKTIKSAKIGGMAFGVGVGLPNILEWSGVVGEGKADWIEAVAKGARYGTNVLAAQYLPGAMRQDLTFEVLFNIMRVGTMVPGLNRYIAGTQGSLDKLADLLALGVFGGDSVQAFELLDGIGARNVQRTQTVLAFFASILADISILRGAEGVLGVSTSLLKLPVSPSNPFPATTRFFKADALATANRVKSVNKWFVPLQYSIAVVLIIDELIYRSGDVVACEAAAFDASDTAAPLPGIQFPFTSFEKSRAGGPVAPEPLSPGREGGARAAKFKPPKLPKAPPTAALTAYLDEIARVTKLVGKGNLEEYADERLPLVAAHDELFAALDPLYDRAVLAAPLVARDQRVALLSFLEARNALAQAASATYGIVESWTAAPEEKVTKSGAQKVLKLLPARAIEANAFVATALQIVSALPVPGGIVLRSGAAPDAAKVLSGAPFTLEVVAYNPGDTAAGEAVAELVPGSALELVSAASQPVPDLGPGEAVALEWQVRGKPESLAGLIADAQVVVTRDGEITTTHNETVVEYDTTYTLP